MIIKERDLYTHSLTAPLRSGVETIGSTTIQYEVQRYVDMRNLAKRNAYIVSCTQRFIVPNPASFSPTAETITSFTNYPALITNAISFSDPDSIVSDMVLLDYSPKTVNTSVTSSQNQATSTNASNTQQYSSGSSVAQTNSFGTSASMNFSLTSLPSFSDNINSSTSTTNQTSSSKSNSTSLDNGLQFSNNSSMALKDWGSYAQLDSTSTMPTWIWGQEYPWNLIDFRNKDDNDNIILPQYVIDRLYDGTQVYPPSELSLLGVNFASKVAWMIELEPGTTDTSSLEFDHSLTLCVASHQVASSDFTATIDTYPDAATQSVTSLNLPQLALDPIGGDNGPALVGFVPGQFAVAPDVNGDEFAIAAESNLMLVRGSGFTNISQTGFMSTDFSKGTVSLNLSFKVTDSASNISLSLKHWVENNVGVTLSISINGGDPVTRHIDSPKSGSGGDNVTVLPLRCKDFSSVNFCDLVCFGLNTIAITLTSDSSSPSADYALMAVAVG